MPAANLPEAGNHRPLVVVVAALVALWSSSLALAGFTASAGAGPMSVSSATLAPPTGVSASQLNCRRNRPVRIGINWTKTVSAFATGVAVERATTSGGPYTTIATLGKNKVTYTDADPALAYSTTYYYVVQSTYLNWTGDSAEVSVTTLSSNCT